MKVLLLHDLIERKYELRENIKILSLSPEADKSAQNTTKQEKESSFGEFPENTKTLLQTHTNKYIKSIGLFLIESQSMRRLN